MFTAKSHTNFKNNPNVNMDYCYITNKDISTKKARKISPIQKSNFPSNHPESFSWTDTEILHYIKVFTEQKLSRLDSIHLRQLYIYVAYVWV